MYFLDCFLMHVLYSSSGSALESSEQTFLIQEENAFKYCKTWLHSARFFTSCAQLQQLPAAGLPEIAFVGRSNAGKSTCINVLTQQNRLAFTSKIPGRTQHINLFVLGKKDNPDTMLADLPGYGYAAVPKGEKLRWQQVMANYLVGRTSLRGVVLLCDARLGLTELDNILLELLLPRVKEGLPFLVLLTKADKLNRNEAAKALQITQLQVGGGTARIFSALKRQGVNEARRTLWEWVHPGATIPEPPPVYAD